MQKEVQELKEISKIINNGVYNIALAKAVQGGAHMGAAPGENMVDVVWGYSPASKNRIKGSDAKERIKSIFCKCIYTYCAC